MPATPISTQTVQGPYVVTPLSAGSLDATFTAADVSNGNSFVCDANGDILIVWNTDSSSHNLTITSQEDTPYLRTGDITNYSLSAGDIAIFNFEPNVGGAPSTPSSEVPGWTDSFNNIFISADNALVKFAIISR